MVFQPAPSHSSGVTIVIRSVVSTAVTNYTKHNCSVLDLTRFHHILRTIHHAPLTFLTDLLIYANKLGESLLLYSCLLALKPGEKGDGSNTSDY